VGIEICLTVQHPMDGIEKSRFPGPILPVNDDDIVIVARMEIDRFINEWPEVGEMKILEYHMSPRLVFIQIDLGNLI
jgi:hypothetical protein